MENVWKLSGDGNSAQSACAHCGLAVEEALIRADRHEQFCCGGCEQVYAFIHSQDLGAYYDFKEVGHEGLARKQKSKKLENYLYLDSESSIRCYAKGDDQRQMNFYVEGVHCSACLFLIEKLPEICEGVKACRLNFSQNRVTVTLGDNGCFSRAAHTLDQLGYRPRPLENEEEASLLKKKGERNSLIRLAVSGFCAGNIMLFSFSIYSGANHQFQDLFNLLSAVLFVPVISYCALPFYRNVKQAWRQQRPTIDLPIVVALLGGTVCSVWRLLDGMAEGYFDSLSVLVFLLLVARYFLAQIQQSCFQASHFQELLSQQTTRCWSAEKNSYETVSASSLQIGDQVEVLAGESFPADGELLDDDVFVDMSALTGESFPQLCSRGDDCYAGTRLIENKCHFIVRKLGEQSRLGTILKMMEDLPAHGGKWVTLSDSVARYFTWALLSVALVFSIVSYPFLGEEALMRALAFVIVACPCALAFGTPLVLARSLKRGVKKGILLKNSEVLEKCEAIKKIFLDKTGTLTEGQMEIVSWLPEKPKGHVLELIYALEKPSKHPIAKTICHALEKDIKGKKIIFDSFEEKAGYGVKAHWQNKTYVIKKAPSKSIVSNEENLYTTVGLYENDNLICRLVLGDQLREGSQRSVEELKEQGYQLRILSGDVQQTVETTAKMLNMREENAQGGLDPSQKAELVEADSGVMMVGDGVNDALALKLSDIAIATQGSLDLSLKVSDVYLTRPGITLVPVLLDLASETRRVLKRNLAISLTYNLLFGAAALMGWVNPLWAAVLMPISSILVLLSSSLGSRACT